MDHDGLMVGCGDKVEKLVEDVRLRATKILKNVKKVGATARLPKNLSLDSGTRRLSFWPEGLLCILALLCLTQAPGTAARTETLWPACHELR